MTLNNSMSITPSSPGQAKGERFEHGSVLGGKTRSARVSSQWKSTGQWALRKQRPGNASLANEKKKSTKMPPKRKHWPSSRTIEERASVLWVRQQIKTLG